MRLRTGGPPECRGSARNNDPGRGQLGLILAHTIVGYQVRLPGSCGDGSGGMLCTRLDVNSRKIESYEVTQYANRMIKPRDLLPHDLVSGP